jgi:predicted nucleic acid-binding protein
VILVDTSVWIDHLRKANAKLSELLNSQQVLCHPMIIGEIALGNLKQRTMVLEALQDLPQAVVAQDAEVLAIILSARLSGTGIGYLDAHLLSSARLSDARLWTRDKKLAFAAANLSLAFDAY